MIDLLLLIDAGNTRLKWATAAPRGKIMPRGDQPTAQVTAVRIKALARQFPREKVVLACVVPRLLPWFHAAFGTRLYNLTGKSRGLPLRFDYPRPGELGADRLAAAIAAKSGPTIIVSGGTASAFTVLNKKGALCGGVIAPGLQAQLSALVAATAQLPTASLREPHRLPARSTADAIRAGVLLSYAGGIREIVAQLQKSLPGKPAPRLLLTGGDALRLRTILGPKAEVRPLLVFEGLRIMGDRLFSA